MCPSSRFRNWDPFCTKHWNQIPFRSGSGTSAVSIWLCVNPILQNKIDSNADPMQYALGGIDVRDLQDRAVTFCPMSRAFLCRAAHWHFHRPQYHSRMHLLRTDISLVTAEECSIQASCHNASAPVSRARDRPGVEPESNLHPPTRAMNHSEYGSPCV